MYKGRDRGNVSQREASGESACFTFYFILSTYTFSERGSGVLYFILYTLYLYFIRAGKRRAPCSECTGSGVRLLLTYFILPPRLILLELYFLLHTFYLHILYSLRRGSRGWRSVLYFILYTLYSLRRGSRGWRFTLYFILILPRFSSIK